MFTLTSQLLTPLGVPIANGSVVMTLNTAATVIATSSPAPSSYTFNLDASGNFVGEVYGGIELTPPSTYYSTTIYSGPNGSGSVVYSTTTWVVGPTQPYSGTLFPDVYALPLISTNNIAGAIISGTPSVGSLIIGTGANSASWQTATYAQSSNPIFTGTVGINAVPSGVIFQVENSALASTQLTTLFDSYSGASGTSLSTSAFIVRGSRGTPSVPAAVQLNDLVGGLAARGYNGTVFSGGQGLISFNAAENWTSSSEGMYCSIALTQTGGVITNFPAVVIYPSATPAAATAFMGFYPVTAPKTTLHLPSTGVAAWDNGSGTTTDTGWSRISQGIIGAGNSTQGDYSGTVKAAIFQGSVFIGGLTVKTSTYGISSVDNVILCITNAFTVTLPTAVGISGQEYTIKNGNTQASFNVITIATTSSQTIDGNTSVSMVPLTAITVVSDGSNWWII